MRQLSPVIIMLGGATLLAAAGCSKHVGWRDLACADLRDSRSVQICQKIERELEWTWTGHAIVSPGWRPTIATARRVYCELPITSADAVALVRIKRHTDWRAASAAQSLLNLLGEDAIAALHSAGDGHGSVIQEIELARSVEASIFNPANPGYVLKGGCDRR